jgi:exosome complex exonuclease RRP6
LFSSQKIVKVFHGCDNDLNWLKADFDIDVINLYDTAKAMMMIAGAKAPESLSFLTNRFLYFYMDKSYQQADWRVRPLPRKMIDYARMDSGVLLWIWRRQIQAMDKKRLVELEKKMLKKSWKEVEGCQLTRVEIDYEG